jgi:hypothetical protein
MIHRLLTKRHVGISFKFVIDVLMFAIVVWCAILYWRWSQIPSQKTRTQSHKLNFFSVSFNRDNEFDDSEKFYFSVLMGLITILMWIRLYL